MVVADIVEIISQFAPIELQEKYDNCGLQIGDANQEVSGILICVDVTEAVLDEAIQLGCNLVLAHHPLIFTGIKTLTGKNYIERCVVKAIVNDIAILIGHTNLDAVDRGVSYKMAQKLGLSKLEVLAPLKDSLLKLVVFIPKSHHEIVRDALFDAGAGIIGNYSKCSFNLDGRGTFMASEGCVPFVGGLNQVHAEDEVRFETILPFFKKAQVLEALKKAHPYEEVAFDIYKLENTWPQAGYGMVGELEQAVTGYEFLQLLKTTFHLQTLRYTQLNNNLIRRVAVMGGSGSDYLKDAIRSKADIFISGDFKYHQFFDADNRIVIADIGHYESEQFTKELFFEILTKKLPTFAICKSSINTNPIKYL